MKDVSNNQTDSQTGSALLGALGLAAVLIIVGAMIASKMAQRVEIASSIAIKSEARSLLNYIGSRMKNSFSWDNTLRGNRPLFNYHVRRLGSAPRPCPRQEECASAPPAMCPANSPPLPCDAPLTPARLTVFDKDGSILIPPRGLFVDRAWNFSSTRQPASIYRINAYWQKKDNFEVDKLIELTMLRPSAGDWKIAVMRQPARACRIMNSAPLRPSTRTFGGWVETTLHCPANYTITHSNRQLHPAHKWPSTCGYTLNDGQSISCATVPESAWVMIYQRNGSRVGIASPSQDYSNVVDPGSHLPRHDNIAQAICCWKGDQIDFFL